MSAKRTFEFLLCVLFALRWNIEACLSRTPRSPTTDSYFYPTIYPLPYGYYPRPGGGGNPYRYRRSISSLKECGRSSFHRLTGDLLHLNHNLPVVNENSMWPWMAGIYVKRNGRTYFKCTGALVSSRSILTSANCLTGFKDTKVLISLGDRKIPTHKYDSSFYSVGKIKIHEDYLQSIENDIGLVVLEKAVNFSKKISPICLPQFSNPNEVYKKNVLVTGW